MRPPYPPPPERSAELRRRFAEEARSERPDLSTLCLLVGAAADGALDETGLDAAQVELDRLAGQLPFRPGGSLSWAMALHHLLGVQNAFRGSPADYQRLESSLLHEVLRRRRGLPILLSVVWMEVARRAGAAVYGVALPGHFVVGFGPPEEQALVDPFDGGRVLGGGDVELLVAGATGAPLDPSMLVPAAPLEVVSRILNNIRAWAAARPGGRTWRCGRWSWRCWCLRIRRGCGTSGLSCSCSGDFVEGAVELEEYAELIRVVDEGAAERVLGQARAARALLN